MLKADHIEPTVDECVIAFSRMIEMVLDETRGPMVH
jgi:hypothetical protein